MSTDALGMRENRARARAPLPSPPLPNNKNKKHTKTGTGRYKVDDASTTVRRAGRRRVQQCMQAQNRKTKNREDGDRAM